ncbi:MAG: hypothetical protein JKX96_09475 [Acinetobacter sp.]|nr:hypothetical protein [Acinetobacter sp.]
MRLAIDLLSDDRQLYLTDLSVLPPIYIDWLKMDGLQFSSNENENKKNTPWTAQILARIHNLNDEPYMAYFPEVTRDERLEMLNELYQSKKIIQVGHPSFNALEFIDAEIKSLSITGEVGFYRVTLELVQPASRAEEEEKLVPKKIVGTNETTEPDPETATILPDFEGNPYLDKLETMLASVKESMIGGE